MIPPKFKTAFTILLTAILTFALTTVWFTYSGTFTTQTATSPYSKLSTVQQYIENNYIGEVDSSQFIDGAVKGLVASVGDPYAEYYTQEEMADLQRTIEGSYTGIGVVVYIDTDDLLTVLAPYDDTPCSRAGILPGDKILQVDNLVVTKENYNTAVDYMKGLTADSKDSDTMKLTISRGGGAPFDVEVTREIINLKTVRYDQYDDIGCIRISGFDEKTTQQFKDALNTIDRPKVKGLIIDLRDNPGGLLDTAVEIADELIPKGTIVSVQNKKGKEKKYTSDSEYNDIPLAVLVNGNSASASEILAGALKDSGRAKLVGTKTFGKGVAQNIIPLRDGTALKLTTEKYFIPSGICIDKVGIEPDISVSLPEELQNYYASELPYDKDIQLQKAIELLN